MPHNMNREELIEYIQLLENELNEKNKTIDIKNKELLNSRAKIISQDITLESYKDKVGIPLIIEGEEKDLYEGEQKDFLIELIENKRDTSDKFSRSYRICESLLSVNHKRGIRDKMKDLIFRIFKNFEGMSSDKISELNKIGLKLSNDSKHFELSFLNDDRYSIHISHTTSNPKRCGLNVISDSNKTMF